MARINWTREALTNLHFISAYIRQFDPVAARLMADRLFDAGNSLTEFPNRGRPTAGGFRELVTVRPYIIRYLVRGNTVDILRIPFRPASRSRLIR